MLNLHCVVWRKLVQHIVKNGCWQNIVYCP